MTDGLEQFLLTLAAALIGTWIGARIALDRFRKERAFDRRMDWHDRALRSARRVFQAAADAEHAIRQGNDDTPFAEERAAATRELGAVLNEGRMYASDTEFKLVTLIATHLAQHQAAVNKLKAEAERDVMAELLDLETQMLGTLQISIAAYGKRLLLGEGWLHFRYRRIRRELRELSVRVRKLTGGNPPASPPS